MDERAKGRKKGSLRQLQQLARDALFMGGNRLAKIQTLTNNSNPWMPLLSTP